MFVVTETARVPVDPEMLWRRIGSFVAVGEWHPLLAKVDSDGDEPGATRRVVTRSGDIRVERLESFDPSLHVYRYSLREHETPVTNYTAEFRIDGTDTGTSIVTWSARFDIVSGGEEEGQRTVREFLKAGLCNLADQNS